MRNSWPYIYYQGTEVNYHSANAGVTRGQRAFVEFMQICSYPGSSRGWLRDRLQILQEDISQSRINSAKYVAVRAQKNMIQPACP